MPARQRIVTLVCLAVVVVVLAAGCSTSTVIDLPQTASSPDGSDATAATSYPAQLSQGGLSSSEVFAAIENSIVYVESPDRLSSGSGIVIEGGWVLTNAHVVDRHAEMTIGRSDGVGLGAYPVHAADWTFDLALIGPVEDSALKPVEPGESAALSLGDRVLLVGFPDEDSIDPTPTLTEGIVSRRRAMALGDYPFLQVDATIAPGQSGGALVDGQGRLVGISGLEFGEGEFGLVFESDVMWPRVELLSSQPPRQLPVGEPVFSLVDEIGPLRNASFLIEVDESGGIDLLVSSADDVYVDVQTLGGITVTSVDDQRDPFGDVVTDSALFVDEQVEGGEDVIASIDAGIYQVIIGSFSDFPGQVEITSANPVLPLIDSEEGSTLPTGEIVEGSIDWARDSDRWTLPLVQGQEVTIVADGIADTIVAVRLDGVLVATSDDEGIGLFGTGSELTFVATTSGDYEVEIGSFDQDRWGYLLQVTIN